VTWLGRVLAAILPLRDGEKSRRSGRDGPFLRSRADTVEMESTVF